MWGAGNNFNEDTVMTHIVTTRHAQIIDPYKINPPITIIGCGAIGSRVFMALVELGMTRITCIDFDHVEPHNLANQAFLDKHIGQPKVHGLKDLYELKTGRPTPDTMLFGNLRLPHDDVTPEGIVFLAVDSFAARLEIARTFMPENVFRVFDFRMASTHGNVLSFSPGSATERWMETLGDDDEAEVSACGTSISVGPTASLIANIGVWQFINYAVDPAAHDAYVTLFTKPMMTDVRSKL